MSLPDKLKKFIVRCYSDIPTEKHPIMEAQLKEVVTNAIQSGRQFEIDWDRMVLPIHTAHLVANTKPQKRKLEDPVIKSVPKKVPASIPRQEPVQKSDVESRRRRFANNQPSLYVDEISLEPVVGRSKALEKSYLRLTGTPNPDVVRPKAVLKKAIKHVIAQYTSKARPYTWVADQLRAIRQDLTVQRIQDPFTIKVYEQNVRIALENSDMGEYNQCLTRLKELYQSDLTFTSSESGEFTAYRIFYLLYTNKLEDIGSIIAHSKDSSDEAISHAIKVVNALVAGNRALFFNLYKHAPNLGKAAMEQVVTRERVLAAAAMTKATKGAIDLKFFEMAMGFDSIEEVREFLARYVTLDPTQESVECGQLSGPIEEAKKKVYQVDIKGQI